MFAIDTATQRSVTLYNPASSAVAGQGATVDVAINGVFDGISIQCLNAPLGVTYLPSPSSPCMPAEAGRGGTVPIMELLLLASAGCGGSGRPQAQFAGFGKSDVNCR
jgi:hypothetical protein